MSKLAPYLLLCMVGHAVIGLEDGWPSWLSLATYLVWCLCALRTVSDVAAYVQWRIHNDNLRFLAKEERR